MPRRRTPLTDRKAVRPRRPRRARTPRVSRVPSTRNARRASPDLDPAHYGDTVRVLSDNGEHEYTEATFVIADENHLLIFGTRSNGELYAPAVYNAHAWSAAFTVPQPDKPKPEPKPEPKAEEREPDPYDPRPANYVP